MFDKTKLIECSEYVYASDERNVQTEVLLEAHTMDILMKMLQLHFQFNIHCGETYKLALVGTISSVGRFVFLPFSGLLADKLEMKLKLISHLTKKNFFVFVPFLECL